MSGLPEWIFAIVRCPVTGEPLAPASSKELAIVARRLASGDLCNRLGHSISTEFGGGLVNSSGTLLFPIRNGIASLVADEAIELDES